ncbi:MAG: tetratricopeptide repeat protein [Xanthobacteraceae bacterium]
MRRARPAFAAACLFSGFAGLLAARAAQAQAQAQAPGVTNAGICASTDDDAYPPQRRVEACSALIDTLADQPTALAAALVNRGTIYCYINKSQLALTDLDRAIALDPKNERAFRERSNTYRTVGRLDKALSDANEAVRLDPNDAQAFEKRGNVFTNNGQYDRAIADYDRAIALDPGFALAYNNRGAAYGKKGDLDCAIADYQQALRVNPQFDQAAQNLADAREERDRRLAAGGDSPVLPTFDCGAAHLAVEKAICSDPDLARLDREIGAVYKTALVNRDGKDGAQLRQDQRDFINARNKLFGNPQYNLKREMQTRLDALRGMSAKASP